MSAIATIPKNTREEIRVQIGEFNGHQLLNIRVWADSREAGAGRVPTKAGVACKVALLPELIAALLAAKTKAESEGLL